MLIIDKIHKSFGNSFTLQEFSLECSEGQIVSFIGPNGSGKTTILNMIAGISRPDSGRISLSGKDVNLYDVKKVIVYY